MKSIRTQKVASSIQSALAELIRRELNDPRISNVGMITITEVDLSPDHRNATIYVSFMGQTMENAPVKEALAALHSSSSFLHRSLKKALPLRSIPQLLFRYDNQFDNAAVINAALKRAQSVEEETKEVRANHEVS